MLYTVRAWQKKLLLLKLNPLGGDGSEDINQINYLVSQSNTELLIS